MESGRLPRRRDGNPVGAFDGDGQNLLADHLENTACFFTPASDWLPARPREKGIS